MVASTLWSVSPASGFDASSGSCPQQLAVRLVFFFCKDDGAKLLSRSVVHHRIALQLSGASCDLPRHHLLRDRVEFSACVRVCGRVLFARLLDCQRPSWGRPSSWPQLCDSLFEFIAFQWLFSATRCFVAQVEMPFHKRRIRNRRRVEWPCSVSSSTFVLYPLA